MAILNSIIKSKHIIDLSGPQGNAFCLLAAARDLSKQLMLEFTDIEKEMVSSDYENLIQIFDKYFGDYVDLVRN